MGRTGIAGLNLIVIENNTKGTLEFEVGHIHSTTRVLLVPEFVTLQLTIHNIVLFVKGPSISRVCGLVRMRLWLN